MAEDSTSVYDHDNIFAKMLRGDIAPSVRYEDERVLAFDDISPATPVHVLVIPRGMYTDIGHFSASATSADIGDFFKAVTHVAEQVLLLRAGGYRIIMNTGAHASQTVQHMHAHILGGRDLGGLLPEDIEHG